MEKNNGRSIYPVLAALVALCVGAASPAQAKKAKKGSKSKTSHAQSIRGGGVHVDRGLDNLEHREYGAAIASFQKAAKLRSDAASYFLLGYAHYQRGFISGAPETADKQDAMETINAYMMALAIDPTLSQLSAPHKLWHSLAMSYEAVGSYEKAVDAYARAIKADPSNPMLPLYHARLSHKMGELDKSAVSFKSAMSKAREQGQARAVVSLVKSSPLFTFMLENPAVASQIGAPQQRAVPIVEEGELVAMRDAVRGTTPAERRRPQIREQDRAVTDALARANDEFKYRRYRAAIEAYQDAMTNNSNSGTLAPSQVAFVYERVGTCYNKLGLSAEAIRFLRKAVQDQPMNAPAHYQLALAYSVSGHYQDSVKALKEAFKTAPSNGELKKLMLLAKTDSELEPVRDLPAFQGMIAEYSDRARGSMSASLSLR